MKNKRKIKWVHILSVIAISTLTLSQSFILPTSSVLNAEDITDTTDTNTDNNQISDPSSQESGGGKILMLI